MYDRADVLDMLYMNSAIGKSLVILLGIDKGSAVHLHCTDSLLGLTVSLRVESGETSAFDVEEVVQQQSTPRDEDWDLITDDGVYIGSGKLWYYTTSSGRTFAWLAATIVTVGLVDIVDEPQISWRFGD